MKEDFRNYTCQECIYYVSGVIATYCNRFPPGNLDDGLTSIMPQQPACGEFLSESSFTEGGGQRDR